MLIAASWSHAGKGLTSWLLFLMFNCVFVTFPCGFLGQMWYLIVSFPDLCRLSYFSYKVSGYSSSDYNWENVSIQFLDPFPRNYEAGPGFNI